VKAGSAPLGYPFGPRHIWYLPDLLLNSRLLLGDTNFANNGPQIRRIIDRAILCLMHNQLDIVPKYNIAPFVELAYLCVVIAESPGSAGLDPKSRERTNRA
jgi:hypothetical protein